MMLAYCQLAQRWPRIAAKYRPFADVATKELPLSRLIALWKQEARDPSRNRNQRPSLFALAARILGRGYDPYRLSGYGALIGIMAFAAVIFSAPLGSALVFRAATALIGFGGGLVAVGTLTAAMSMSRNGQSGLALGAWGAAQATALGPGNRARRCTARCLLPAGGRRRARSRACGSECWLCFCLPSRNRPAFRNPDRHRPTRAAHGYQPSAIFLEAWPGRASLS